MIVNSIKIALWFWLALVVRNALANENTTEKVFSTANTVYAKSRQIKRLIVDEEYSAALKLLDEVLENEPNDFVLWRQKAEVGYRLQRFTDALAAVKVVLLKTHDDVTLWRLANEIIVNLPDKSHALNELTKLYQNIPATITAEVFANLINHESPNFSLIISAWQQSEIYQEANAIMRWYAQNDFITAQKLSLDENTPPILRATIAYLLARELLRTGENKLAEQQILIAEKFNYDQLMIALLRAEIYLFANDNFAAAQTLALIWRLSPEPIPLLVRTAFLYLNAKRADLASEILSTALRSFPDQQTLSAWYLLALKLNNDETKFLADKKNLNENEVAYWYGNALITSYTDFPQSVDIATRNAYLRRYPAWEKVREIVEAKTGREFGERLLMEYLQGEFTTLLAPAAPNYSAIALRLQSRGWEFWDKKLYHHAFISWSEAAENGSDKNKPFIASVAMRLLEAEMNEAAMAWLSRYLPAISLFDFACSLAKRERWELILPVLNAAEITTSAQKFWANLFGALGALRKTSIAQTKPYWQNLAQSSPEKITVQLLDEQNFIYRQTFDLHDFRHYLKILSDYILQDQASELYPQLASKNIWRNLPMFTRAQLSLTLVLSAHFPEFMTPWQNANNPPRAFRYALIWQLLAQKQYAFARELAEIYFADNDEKILRYQAILYDAFGENEKAEKIWYRLYYENSADLLVIAGLCNNQNALAKYAETLRIIENKSELLFNEKTFSARIDNDLLNILIAYSDAAIAQEKSATATEKIVSFAQWQNSPRLIDRVIQLANATPNYPLLENVTALSLTNNQYQTNISELYASALLAQKKFAALQIYSEKLLANNAHNLIGYHHLREVLNEQREARKILDHEKTLAAKFTDDPLNPLTLAIAYASVHQYQQAFTILENHYENGVNGAMAILYYPQISRTPIGGALDLAQLENHLSTLSREYIFTPLSAVKQKLPIGDKNETAQKVPLAIIFNRVEKSLLRDVDKILERYNARAGLIIGVESLYENTPNYAEFNELKTLAKNGRWEFILTDSENKKITYQNNLVSFWAHKKVGENNAQMQKRWRDELQRLKNHAGDLPIVAWAYPNNNYGQKTFNGEVNLITAYRNAVEEVFGIGVIASANAYNFPASGEQWRTNMLALYAAIDGETLRREILTARHPERRAILELAKVTSWHGQFPRAEKLFNRVNELKVDAKETAYFSARNAQFMDDQFASNQRAPIAYSLDRANERTTKLLNDAKKMLRPRVNFAPTYTHDSDNRDFYELLGDFSFSPFLPLRTGINFGNRYWQHHGLNIFGTVIGANAEYFIFAGHSLSVNINYNLLDRAQNFWEGALRWRGTYARDLGNINGDYDFIYEMRRVNTLEAIREKIDEHNFRAETTLRFLNRGQLESNGYLTLRSDDNRTAGMLVRPTWRVLETPVLRVGYWGAFADSNHNPNTVYYAPVEYMSHSLTAMVNYRFKEYLTFDGSVSSGFGISRGNTWQWQNRFNAGVNIKIKSAIDLNVKYQHLELPDYSLQQITGGVNITF